MRAPLAKREPGIVLATVFAVIGVAILIGLGVWQLERKTWKENLIAAITARVDQPAEQLPARGNWARLNAGTDEYRRVTFRGEFLKRPAALVYTAGSALRPDVSGAGYWVFAPARLADGGVIAVNRGFVPYDRKDVATHVQGEPEGMSDIVGFMRWPETAGLFTPAHESNDNVWYLRDPQAMAQAENWGTVAPFYIDQESPVPPGGLPKPGKIEVSLPDNHLQYAITWFGLALGLTGVYALWLVRRLNARA